MTLRFLRVLMLGLLVLHAAAWASDKKGVGVVDRTNGKARIEALNVSWYYNWSPFPTTGMPADKFVPMWFGSEEWTDRHLAQIESLGKPKFVLGPNEPDGVKQSNRSAQEVAKLWPRFQKLGENIGSPATVHPGNAWFDSFNQRVQRDNLKMDFVALHIYGPPRPERLLRIVDETWEKYRKPIWITEFAVADWKALDTGVSRFTPEEALAFMKAVLPELEKRSYVHRYAWFGTGPSSARPALAQSALFDSDGKLTPLGEYYANFRAGPRKP